MMKRNYLTFTLGILVASSLLLLDDELSVLTILLWPSWIFLMVLGGEITGFGDYIFIGFTIILNGVIYMLIGMLVSFIRRMLKLRR